MTYHIENEVYKKLHANQELHIDDLRRARDYQAGLFEANRAARTIKIASYISLALIAINVVLFLWMLRK